MRRASFRHDFQPEARVPPVGILVPTLDELFVYGVLSKVTSDCLADCLTQWWEAVRARFDCVFHGILGSCSLFVMR